MLANPDNLELTAKVADLAGMRADEAKTLCARRIEAVATITDQLNHTPEQSAVFKPWCAAMRAHYQGLKAELREIGAFWNPIETPDQDAFDAKDIGYNEAVARVDVASGWPAFPGWDVQPAPSPTIEHRFPASLDEKLGDWDIPEEGAADAEKQKIVSGFIDILKSGKEIADNTFRQMSADDRVKLFPILNDELGKLQNEEALLNKPLQRRADVQSLLGILAKVGEA